MKIKITKEMDHAVLGKLFDLDKEYIIDNSMAQMLVDYGFAEILERGVEFNVKPEKRVQEANTPRIKRKPRKKKAIKSDELENKAITSEDIINKDI